MKALIKFASIISLFFMFSCGKTLDTEKLFNNDSDYFLKVYLGDKFSSDSSCKETFEEKSETIVELQKWFEANNSKWKSSIVSWATPDKLLRGQNFRLLIFQGFVVLIYPDTDGKELQFTKQIGISELDFLNCTDCYIDSEYKFHFESYISLIENMKKEKVEVKKVQDAILFLSSTTGIEPIDFDIEYCLFHSNEARKESIMRWKKWYLDNKCDMTIEKANKLLKLYE
ncbi:MAG: hypothetical protein R6V23_15630 [Bacteroidales bacterium]